MNNDTPKCPVTFFKNKCINDNLDLNYMMVAPYHSNLAANITRSASFDSVKKDIIASDKITRYHNCNLINYTAIYSYVKMNVTDLFTRLHVKTFNNFFGNSLGMNNITIDLQDKPQKLTDSFYLPMDIKDPSALYPIVDSQMELIFQNSVTLLNSWVEANLGKALTRHFSIEFHVKEFYEKKYRECFGIADDIDLGQASFENTAIEDVYTFLSSIYREVIMNELYEYRHGLGLIGVNAINMAIDTPEYFAYDNLVNPDYNTLRMTQDTPILNFMTPVISQEENTNDNREQSE